MICENALPTEDKHSHSEAHKKFAANEPCDQILTRRYKRNNYIGTFEPARQKVYMCTVKIDEGVCVWWGGGGVWGCEGKFTPKTLKRKKSVLKYTDLSIRKAYY